ncbi:MAG: glycosyltransferase [Balneolaceae bacterium]
MNTNSLDIVIIGLSISSSWGNGHATTYRSLVKGLHQEGHQVHFLERDIKWYAAHRDLKSTPYCRLNFYKSPGELMETYHKLVRDADLVIVGSYLKDGVDIGEWVTGTARGVTAFYDIDTPVTLSKLKQKDYEYISPGLIPAYNMYLSFTGGSVPGRLEETYKSPMARPLYCSVDPDLYYPEEQPEKWQLGYLGTYSHDRQAALKALLLDVAEERPEDAFVVAGPQYPPDIDWPGNVSRMKHLPPGKHCRFYNRQRFTLNVTRHAMIDAGFSPSVRLFEAAACAVPVISDAWDGLETFFEPDREILIATSTNDVTEYLESCSDGERDQIGRRAREKILGEHSSRVRARQLVRYIGEFENVAV